MVNALIGKKIYLDTSVLIYAIEVPQQFPKLRAALIEPLAKGKLTLVTSWITLAEVLIKPLQTRDSMLEITYRQFLTPSAHFEILPVDQTIIDQAATLRAMHGFRLPDAIHLATGMVAGCSHYVTGDTKWAKAGLQIIEASNL